MTLGLLTVDLHIPMSRSLKGKRRVLKSLRETVRNRFNISIAEVDHHDKWQRAVLAIACVAMRSSEVHRLLNRVLQFIEDNGESELIDARIETF